MVGFQILAEIDVMSTAVVLGRDEVRMLDYRGEGQRRIGDVHPVGRREGLSSSSKATTAASYSSEVICACRSHLVQESGGRRSAMGW